ncbi:MAG: hypothetical protein EKK62_16145 [Acidimicrobiia bacterium]|nr:hypothetical protein [Microthrixaceae bacterium]RTL04555.1 MAG: hypothetical protein EKK62_16145 [Acidimicrobiia bacterium]
MSPVPAASIPADARPDTTRSGLGERWRAGWDRYWFDPVPVERVDVFARIIAVVVAFTVVSKDGWAAMHADAPVEFYRPVLLARVLHLPAPTPTTMLAVRVLVVVGAVWMLTRRAPRAAAAVTLVSYGVWLLWAFSYAKVDHDRLTIMVALLVLALTPRTGISVERLSGWALRVVQVVFVLAYPFSAWGKLRFGGWEWMGSAVFTASIIRRGTVIGDRLLSYPDLLVLSQWVFIVFEVMTIVLLFPRAPRRLRIAALVGVLLLHAMTYLMIGISFLPHTICITAFLPLEHLSRRWRVARVRGPDPADLVT